MKPTVKIENWYLMGNNNPYLAPELQHKHLEGNVYGHPDLEEGKFIRTSDLVSIDMEKRIAETQNTLYELGEMEAGYAQYIKELS